MTKVKNVLIVDDNLTTNLLHQKVVENYNEDINTDVVINGKEGLEYLANNYPEIILMDLNMPIMDGFDFLRELKKEQIINKTNVIVITSSNDPKDKQKCLEITTDIQFMVKPLLIHSIKEIVENIENN